MTPPPTSEPAARSQLLAGTVRHRRHQPREHAFRYRLFHVLLDLGDLDRLDREIAGFGHNRAAPTSFYDRDHLDETDEPVRDKLGRWLRRHGRSLPDGPVHLWTSLRVFGYVFNPVSWFFCYSTAGELELVVAEVNNTFGERYCYLLDDLEQRGGTWRAQRAKRFHVSPFLPVDGLDYTFRFRPPAGDGRTVAVHMDVHDEDGEVVFDATLAERPEPLTTASLWRAVVRHPFVTVMTIVRIHWQAVKLWWKRVPFFHKPVAPDNGLDGAPTPSDSAQHRSLERAS
ncbi:MAG: DUF1365 domain-containing protein [Nitriliruptorales bacterium]|nr:DUF1365 domain-containing protein [Nitriliruptorales bacterium]